VAVLVGTPGKPGLDLGAVITWAGPEDLPDAVAGVRTVAAGVYQLYDQIDIGTDEVVLAGNVVLRGFSKDHTGLTTNSANPLLTCSGFSLELQHVGLINPGGKTIDYTGAATTELTIENCKFTNGAQDTVAGVASGPLATSCPVRESFWQDGAAGVKFSGDFSALRYNDVAFRNLSGAGARFIELDPAITATVVSVSDCFFQVASGQTGIWAPPALTLASGGEISGCTKAGDGDLLGGIAIATALQWRFVGNHRSPDSSAIGAICFSGNTTQNTWTRITTGVAWTLASGGQRMSLVNGDELQLDNTFPGTFACTVALTVEAAANNQVLQARLVLDDGSPTVIGTITFDYKNVALPGTLPFVASLDEGDILYVEVQNTISAADITVSVAAVSASEQ
jgi:hypothetical protein